MARRIEIELTSARPDGSWTWRAAGAREPKGILDGSLLPPEAKAGDRLKAEADFLLEGINIISVTAPKTDGRTEAARIEVVGPSRVEVPGVTTQLVGRSDRRQGDRRRDRDGHERDGGDRGARRDRGPARPQVARDGARPPREAGGGEGGPRPQVRDGRGADRRDHARGPDRPRPSDQSGESAGATRSRRPANRVAPDGARSGGADRTRAKRFSPGNVHRKAVMDSLPPEQQPIAEQVLRGGIPAVRTALHLEREKAVAEGRAAPNSDELIAMAESLLPKLKTAEWHDRAEAAATDADGISLRDLRSVVTGADVARDEETRALAATLREALERRLARLLTDWTDEISKHLDEHRVVRAVRLSSRPPEPSARLDTELSTRLTEAASQAMSAEASPDLWASLLDAVVESPIRRSVKPTGIPENAPPELRRSAHQQSGSIPALAKLLGVAIPPPPLPSDRRRPERPAGERPRGPRQPRERRPSQAAEGPTAEKKAVSEKAVSEKAVSEKAVSEKAVSETAVSEQAGAELMPADVPAPESPAEDTQPAPDATEAIDQPAPDATEAIDQPAPDPAEAIEQRPELEQPAEGPGAADAAD